jgi:hypothetical protein
VSATYNPGATWDNAGALNIADGVSLTMPAKGAGTAGTFTDDTNGSVNANGVSHTGVLAVRDSNIYNQGAGTTVGVQPVFLINNTLNYTGAGQSKVTSAGTSTLTGDLAANQVLTVLGVACGDNIPATLTKAGNLTDGGSIVITASGCGAQNATLALTSGTLTIGSAGSLTFPTGSGGTHSVNANVTNNGTIGPSGLGALTINGNYTQGSTGKYMVNVNTPNSSDHVTVNGTATVGGSLTAVAVSGFTPASGNSWTNLFTATVITGTYSSVTGPGGTWTATVGLTSVTLTKS